MLNQERVREITRLAILDKNEGRECKPMTQYFRKDYIAKEMIKSLAAGSVAFGALAGMVGLYCVESLMQTIGSFDIRQLAQFAVIGYVACLAAYLSITYAVYNARYSKGRLLARKFYARLKKVNKLYYEEEQM